MNEIQSHLIAASDPLYREFQAKLLPTVKRSRILGVRIPEIRRYARALRGSPLAVDFLAVLPHETYDEDNLHAALLESIRDFDTALAEVERFLPHVDNWATCDGFCPKILRTQPDRLWASLLRWLASREIYTVRFALVRLTAWYLDAPLFSTAVLDAALSARGDDYYVRMAQAWLFSVALVKQYEAALPYLTDQRLPAWVHNKAIQKAIESDRISPLTKQYLKTLKRR